MKRSLYAALVIALVALVDHYRRKYQELLSRPVAATPDFLRHTAGGSAELDPDKGRFAVVYYDDMPVSAVRLNDDGAEVVKP